MSPESSSGPTVSLGLFDWVDADGVRPAGQLYRERLDLVAYAESCGFDVYHLAEHHGTPLGLVPSPSVFLAAAAMRTSRIRLCPLVYVLPLYLPARLAEEIAMLDQLSEGRLEIGFGKGGNPYELLAYGVDPGDAQRLYDDIFDTVLRSLETGTIGAPGKTAEQDFARAIEQGLVIAGSAGTVRTQLTDMMRATGCNHFAGAFAFGSLSYAEARSSLARFADEVAPALRGLDPAGSHDLPISSDSVNCP